MIDRNTAAVSVFQAGFEATRELEVRPQGRAGTSPCRSAATAWSGYLFDIVRMRFAGLSWTLGEENWICSFSVTQFLKCAEQRLFALNLLRQRVSKYFRF